MSTCLISIIIPSYRTEAQVLQRCLVSVNRQRFDDSNICIECLILFDGKPDPSLIKMIRQISLSDSIVFKPVVLSHSGVSTTRNQGIKLSQGKWIAFVDADDELPDNALNTLVEYGDKYNCDIVQGSYITKLAASTEHHIYQPESVLFEREKLEELRYDILSPDQGLGLVWGKLFLRSFLIDNSILFDSSVAVGEDTAFVFSAALAAKRVGSIPQDVYRYYRNMGSAVTAFRSDYVDRIVTSMRAMRKLIIQSNHPEYISGLNDYVLFHLLLIQLHYLFHPQAPWTEAERKAEYRRVLAMTVFAEPLRLGGFQRFGLAKRISLSTLRHHWFLASRFIAWIRRLQINGL